MNLALTSRKLIPVLGMYKRTCPSGRIFCLPCCAFPLPSASAIIQALQAPPLSAYLSTFPLRGSSPLSTTSTSTAVTNMTAVQSSSAPPPETPRPASAGDTLTAAVPEGMAGPSQVLGTMGAAAPAPADPPMAARSPTQPGSSAADTRTSPEESSGDVPTDTASGDSGSSLSITFIVGAVGGGVVLLTLCSLLAIFASAKLRRGKNKQRAGAGKTPVRPQASPFVHTLHARDLCIPDASDAYGMQLFAIYCCAGKDFGAVSQGSEPWPAGRKHFRDNCSMVVGVCLYSEHPQLLALP